MVDDEYKTIPPPNWALGSRTEGHYTDTTARYVKWIKEGEKSRLCTLLSERWLEGHVHRGDNSVVGTEHVYLNTKHYMDITKFRGIARHNTNSKSKLWNSLRLPVTGTSRNIWALHCLLLQSKFLVFYLPTFFPVFISLPHPLSSASSLSSYNSLSSPPSTLSTSPITFNFLSTPPTILSSIST